MKFYECLNVINDDVYDAIYYIHVKFYECLNVINDDVCNAIYYVDENFMNV
jgi:hypothetical protein